MIILWIGLFVLITCAWLFYEGSKLRLGRVALVLLIALSACSVGLSLGVRTFYEPELATRMTTHGLLVMIHKKLEGGAAQQVQRELKTLLDGTYPANRDAFLDAIAQGSKRIDDIQVSDAELKQKPSTPGPSER